MSTGETYGRMGVTKALGCALTVLGLAEADFARAAIPADDQQPWRVVLIRSWDSLYRINIQRESALREAMVENAPRVVEFYPEEMDPLRFPASPEDDLVALLQRKYRDTRVDLVIASGKEPLEFASRHRDSIWPGAAIVFNGVIEGTLDGWQRPPRTTGVTMPLDVEGTIAVGRALVPNAKRLYVLSGTAPFDGYLLDLVMKKLGRIAPPMEVREVVGLTREEIRAQVPAFERDSLVLYLTMLRDGAGQVSGPGSPTMALVSESSKVPVLSLFRTQYGRGPVGGSAPQVDVHGRAAGELARRVLTGANVDALPIAAVPEPSCEVDWNRLKHWRIWEGRVPPRCTIANSVAPERASHVWQLLALAAIVLLQAALLWSLVLQSRRRRVAEAKLLARSAELAHEARLATIGSLTAGIAHEINQPMGSILSNTEAAQMMLAQGVLEPGKLNEILGEIRNEVLRGSNVIRSLRNLLAHTQGESAALEVNGEVCEALGHVAFEASRRGATIAPVLGREMPAIMGDPVQLQQVVINLVMNAMDAVAPLSEGEREIRIETRASAGGAEIAVLDHGTGLAPEDAARVFQTNFTTKADGMGFGLSIVRGIVELHRGRVWFEPNTPRGAIFRVWLPAAGA